MRRRFLWLWVLAGASLWGQITVLSPSSMDAVRPAADYATQVFQDPWDMNERTDLGWYTFGIDQPPSNLTNITFANGIFSATGTSNQPNFWLLDSASPTAAPVGKIGANFPIASTQYRRLLMRLNLNLGGIGQLVWSNNTIYNGLSVSNGFLSHPGWWIYSVDIPTLGVVSGTPWSSKPVDSLRVQPVNVPGATLALDWARLVAYDPTVDRVITWSGSGPVDIFLDNDKNFSNGFVAQIATNVSGGSFEFYAGGLPCGIYYVAIRPSSSTSTPAYSSGAYVVDDIPYISFTAPSPSGSADDFATVQLNDPWDMTSLSDIDYTTNVTGLAATTINGQDEAGHPLSNVNVIQGTSAPAASNGSGDPNLFTLFWADRGDNYRIDTSRYRILTFNQCVTGDRDLVNGSIARVEWRVHGESLENVSDDIELHQIGGINVMQKFILDMKKLQLETDGGSPSTTGWNGMLDGFRIHPEEFSNPRLFYLGDIKLAALEKANGSYTIGWNYNYAGKQSPTLSLYYGTAPNIFAGTLIAAGLNPATGSYTWNIGTLPPGTYYIYAQLAVGGTVVNQTYAMWPVVVDHTYVPLPDITLSKQQIQFGATRNGSTNTGPQPIAVTVTGGNPQSVGWNVSSNQVYLQVSPSSGVGNGTFTISLASSVLPSPSYLDATITLTATGVSNSPQYVRVFVNVINPSATQPPFGFVDTPADHSTGISGAIPMTGWAMDDIGVQKVDIWRDPVGGENAQNGLVYVGDAVFIDGTRPDVQAINPTLPLSTRAGWGFQILTNMLSNSSGSGAPGNGIYRFHALAHDVEGHTVDIGARTVTVDNADAILPFGTIDTPSQGGTASGTAFVNFGWALTPQPNSIPGGSAITVFIDNLPAGHPQYGFPRSDVTSLFPGLKNTSGPIGYYMIDTTTLANGMHSIAWSVTDSAGHTTGLGSRYFFVQN
jgi:hypothetical protein